MEARFRVEGVGSRPCWKAGLTFYLVLACGRRAYGLRV